MSRLYVVDGYNVIHTVARYASVAVEDMEGARELLISDVAAFAGGDVRAVVVFDAASNPESDGVITSHAGIGVIYSAHQRDADSAIERLVSDNSDSFSEIVVVTSDQTTQWVTLGSGVTRRSSREFAHELGSESQDRLEHPTGEGRRVTVAARIDAETRALLERMARGGSGG